MLISKIKRTSEGKKRNKANDNAKEIEYHFNITNNTIVFDAFFLSAYKNIWKDEEIKATVYIPEGTTVYFENSSRKFIDDIKNTQDIYDRDMANHHFKMTSRGFECRDCTSSNNFNDDKNDDVSFLFDSTINNTKSELIITKETTKNELKKLASWFKNRKGIDIDFSESSFYDNGKIKIYSLKVNCNDGFKGKSSSSKSIVIGDEKHGFIRNYGKNDSLNFKIW